MDVHCAPTTEDQNTATLVPVSYNVFFPCPEIKRILTAAAASRGLSYSEEYSQLSAGAEIKISNRETHEVERAEQWEIRIGEEKFKLTSVYEVNHTPKQGGWSTLTNALMLSELEIIVSEESTSWNTDNDNVNDSETGRSGRTTIDRGHWLGQVLLQKV